MSKRINHINNLLINLKNQNLFYHNVLLTYNFLVKIDGSLKPLT